MNKQEIAQKELDGAKATQAAVKTELDRLRGEAESINKLYKEQDELLGESRETHPPRSPHTPSSILSLPVLSAIENLRPHLHQCLRSM